MNTNPTGSGIDYFYCADAEIDAAMDAAIRSLLCACFTAPEHARFRTQRYFYSPYPHRWVARAGDRLIGHVGIHDRELIAAADSFRCGGIADACVHPDFRGRGLLKRLLQEAHAWLCGRGCAFSILFGEEGVYRSSGYAPVLLRLEDPSGLPQPLPGLAAPLGSAAWPGGCPELSGGLY